MDHTLITNYVIQENVPGGRNRYDGWLHQERGLGLSERAGGLRNKKVLCLSGRRQLCYRKYRILCILNNRPFGKGKCKKYIYSELRFDRLVEDGKLGCPAELSFVL